MKQGINSSLTGNLLGRAGNLQRLAGNCPPCAGISPELSRFPHSVVETLTLKTAVGFGWSTDCLAFSTLGCISRARGVGASATDGPEGKLGRLSRGFAASVAGPSTAPQFLRARVEKWRQRETPSRRESPGRVNSPQ